MKLKWLQLKEGDQLGTYDSVLTCERSSVMLRSDFAFDSAMDWISRDKGFVGYVPPEHHLTIHTWTAGQPKIQAEAIEVTGKVFYSVDPPLTLEAGPWAPGPLMWITEPPLKNKGDESQQPPKRSREERERRQLEYVTELEAIGWGPLSSDLILGPWDMIRIEEKGCVEIEILEVGDKRESYPHYPYFHKKSFTGRFDQRSYFIMVPDFYRTAKINKIIGEAWIGRNQEKIKEFWHKYPVLYDIADPREERC